MDFNFDFVLNETGQLAEMIRVRREACSAEVEKARQVERSVSLLMFKAVAPAYNDQTRLRGHKVQWPGSADADLSQDQSWVFWRIYLDGLTGIDVVDVANLQPQPG